MQNFIKTIINAVQTWTKKEIKNSTADWNQNDANAADYVKNRTHWTEKAVIVKEQVVSGFFLMQEPIYAALNPFNLNPIVGNVYTVIWDGVSYELEMVVVDEAGGLGCIGNTNYAFMESGGSIPFAIIFAGDIFLVTESIEDSHTISIFGDVIHKIDKKYLPDTIFSTYIQEELEDGTLLATHGSEDIFAAKESGMIVEFYDWNGIKYDFDGGYSNECYFKSVSLYYEQAVTKYACIYADKTIELFDEKYVPTTERIEAKVGQTIVVQETDENGMPISWEAIDRHRFDVITLTDEVNGYEYIVKMKNGTLATVCRTDKISVITMPTKTEYLQGERFDPTGMVIMATRQDGSTYEADISTYTEPVLETPFTVSYVEAGIPYSTTIDLTVNEFNPEVQLIDFDYYQEEDGTYRINGWKGTLNGVPSTELVLPNSALVEI